MIGPRQKGNWKNSGKSSKVLVTSIFLFSQNVFNVIIFGGVKTCLLAIGNIVGTAYADDKLYVTEKLKFGLGRVENAVVKEENSGYQHFFSFPTMFSKDFFFKVVKIQYCVVKS